MRIGIQRKQYPELRNILSINQERVAFEMERLAPEMIEERFQVARSRITMFKDYTSMPEPGTGVDCYHYFNSIPLTDVPFVTTFETVLPRWYGVDDEILEYGLSTLAGAKCRRLFALSANCAALMRSHMEHQTPQHAADILSKVDIVYPPQEVQDGASLEKFDDLKQLKVVFIGADFQRKGGFELVTAAARLIERGANINVTLIARLQPRPEKAIWSSLSEARASTARALIERHHQHFTLHEWLPHPHVMSLIAESHISALPSFHDTFGFSILESQASYTPVITTNQRAFPELNSEATGWILPLPVNKFNQIICSEAQFPELSGRMTDNLEAVLETILTAGAGVLKAKAAASAKRIQTQHDPRHIADAIFQFYGSQRPTAI